MEGGCCLEDTVFKSGGCKKPTIRELNGAYKTRFPEIGEVEFHNAIPSNGGLANCEEVGGSGEDRLAEANRPWEDNTRQIQCFVSLVDDLEHPLVEGSALIVVISAFWLAPYRPGSIGR